jgi:peptide/nickel transport system ATP-binding protein/oligopeptide transport system ATP-binding protein
MAHILDVRGLTVELPTRNGWVRPVNDVSFALNEGETLGIVGESGSGKTILSLALMGLDPHGARRTGEAWLAPSLHRNGDAATSENILAASPQRMRALRGREIAMIFQEPMTALNPVMRVGAQVEEAIRVHEPSLSESEIRRRAIESLTRASLPEAEHRSRQYPHQLSGGLRQRVMIAMALAAKPSILIADEPTTALDVTVQKQILELLADLRRDLGLSMLFITHDLGVVAQVADRVAVMYAGRIVEEGPVDEVLRAPKHPYTEGLLRAAPRLVREKLVPIPGTVPALDSLPKGCAFAPRCSYRIAECEATVPGLRRVNEHHTARCILVPEHSSGESNTTAAKQRQAGTLRPDGTVQNDPRHGSIGAPWETGRTQTRASVPRAPGEPR